MGIPPYQVLEQILAASPEAVASNALNGSTEGKSMLPHKV